jgi:hypothetical protein
MAHSTTRPRRELWRIVLAIACVYLLAPAQVPLLAQAPTTAPPPAAPRPATAPPMTPAPGGPAPAAAPVNLTPDQLDSLVAPIALYPDPLLAQTLAASTYPLEIIQLQQWMAKNPGLKDKALADAVAKQPWDPAVQSLAPIPELTKRLADDIQWTTELGNAFLAQQSDVMDAVQRMRKKAQGTGALTSNEQQKVETKIIETKEIIVVEPAKPEVVYVPVYSPTVVYGPPVYPYPPVYYPPYTPGAAFVTFGVGMMVGAAIWGGTCCGCGWGHGHGNVNVNVHNTYNRNTNVNRGGNNNWQHNAQHRGGTPYGDRATANKYGGSARGDSLSSRQQQARGGPSASNRASNSRQASTRPSGNYSSSNRAGASDRSASGNRGAGDRGASARTSDRAGGGGGDRIGSRDIGGGGNSSSRGGGFGSSNGFSGSSARASSSRGASSFGGRGGGGGGRRR